MDTTQQEHLEDGQVLQDIRKLQSRIEKEQERRRDKRTLKELEETNPARLTHMERELASGRMWGWWEDVLNRTTMSRVSSAVSSFPLLTKALLKEKRVIRACSRERFEIERGRGPS